ncbi:hypothetical protein FGG08_002201 [Glutinoglossum americanum]|uniref:Uncharacterized protein n=1 Tax=Glutinoglossum americanum TaxID=1670608 RepID=A0A9P8I9S5_9PEZI|nr:hypothetical protein FGG08_002201 [Glutinoglossum americanum]
MIALRSNEDYPQISRKKTKMCSKLTHRGDASDAGDARIVNSLHQNATWAKGDTLLDKTGEIRGVSHPETGCDVARPSLVENTGRFEDGVPPLTNYKAPALLPSAGFRDEEQAKTPILNDK